jgi:hypothetical protein
MNPKLMTAAILLAMLAFASPAFSQTPHRGPGTPFAKQPATGKPCSLTRTCAPGPSIEVYPYPATEKGKTTKWPRIKVTHPRN